MLQLQPHSRCATHPLGGPSASQATARLIKKSHAHAHTQETQDRRRLRMGLATGCTCLASVVSTRRRTSSRAAQTDQSDVKLKSQSQGTPAPQEEQSWWDGFVEFFEALEIINGPLIEEEDSPEAKALTKQIDYVEELRRDLDELTKKRAYLREQAESTLGIETNKLFFLGADYWRMRIGRVFSKRVVRQGFANLFSAANLIFVIIFLRTVVPRLLAVQNIDDLFLVANELGTPTRANLEATLVGFQEYDFLFKLGLYQLAFILEKVTLISELLPIQIGLKTLAPLLFGGLIPGALISATCETIGASVNFFIGRTFFTDRLRTLSFFGGEPLGEAKWFGSLNRVAGEDGFQLVLLLRLAHVLPLPFDSYWYIFGALPVQFTAFFAAHWLGCLKTAFLDASLGELLLASVTLDTDDKQQLIAIETGALAVVALAVSSIATGLANRLLALEEMEEAKAASQGAAPTDLKKAAAPPTDGAAQPSKPSKPSAAASLPAEASEPRLAETQSESKSTEAKPKKPEAAR